MVFIAEKADTNDSPYPGIYNEFSVQVWTFFLKLIFVWLHPCTNLSQETSVQINSPFSRVKGSTLNGDTHKPTDTIRHFSLSVPEQECEQAVTSETVYVILAVLCSVKAKKQRKKNKIDMIHWLHKNWVCDVMVCQSYSVYLTLVQKKERTPCFCCSTPFTQSML